MQRGGGAAGVVAIVPVNALAAAKGRLAGDLDPAARRELTAWMVQRVLAACREAAFVQRIVVVAGDADAAELARGRAEVVVVQERTGLTAAMTLADGLATSDAPSMVVAADLPLVTAWDLAEVVTACPPGGGVVVAPTSDGGTGVLVRAPHRCIPTAYGAGSAARHLQLATRAGVPAVRVDVANLALDVDTAEALRSAADRQPALAPFAALLGTPSA